MKIKHLHFHLIQIPLKVRFSQSNNSTSTSDSLVVSLETTTGIAGHGESCPRPYVTGEDTETVSQNLEMIESILLKKDFDTLDSIRNWVCEELPSKMGLASICALELALLDAWAKTHQTSVIKALGGNPDASLTYSGVAPIANLEVFPKVLHLIHSFGFRNIKLKVGADLKDTVARVNLVKEKFGPDVNIRFDANCSWTYEQACEQIPVFLDLGVNSFEQIFLPGMDDNMGRITQQFGDRARIMADESVTTFQSAQRLIEKGSCNHFNLKISKHGGLFNTLRIYQLAKANGIGCQMGAHFGETSILTAAGIILGSIAPDLTHLEGAFGQNLLSRSICTYSLGFDSTGQIKKVKDKLSETGLGFGEMRSLTASA